MLHAVRREFGGLKEFPDVVAAGSTVVMPIRVYERDSDGAPTGRVSPVPFLTGPVELVSCAVADALGIAALHLLWAIDWIRLGELPLSRMIQEHVTLSEMLYPHVPMRRSLG